MASSPSGPAFSPPPSLLGIEEDAAPKEQLLPFHSHLSQDWLGSPPPPSGCSLHTALPVTSSLRTFPPSSLPPTEYSADLFIAVWKRTAEERIGEVQEEAIGREGGEDAEPLRLKFEVPTPPMPQTEN